MTPPVANPPAPDVEAIARRLDALLKIDGWRTDHNIEVYTVTRELLESARSALTAHTASLQARVEELERAKADTVEIADQALAIAQAERDEAVKDGAWEKRRADDLEAEANRMREALKKALPILDENYRWHRDMQSAAGRTLDAHAAAEATRAALRPADEPVTQREMSDE